MYVYIYIYKVQRLSVLFVAFCTKVVIIVSLPINHCLSHNSS